MVRKTLILLITLLFVVVLVGQHQHVFASTLDKSDDSTDRVERTNPGNDYFDHLQRGGAKRPQIDPIRIYGRDYSKEQTTADVEILRTLDGSTDVLLTPEEEYVSWEVSVPEAGYYRLYIRYYPIEGKSSNIERILYINGEVQFDGADRIVLPRIWKSQEMRQDINGNDIKPRQIEAPRWRETYLQDELGYITEPYLFYFEEGINTITLESIKEPLVIDYIEIRSYEKLPTYEEVLAEYQAKGYKIVEGQMIKIQAEDAFETSSPTLYPLTDRSSSKTEPFEYNKIRLNVIGGERWRINGDFITWKVNVPEAGLYKISFRAKQSFSRGMFVNRELWINDQIPFEEAKYLEFNYSSKWQMVTLGNGEEDYLFYFETGENTITLVASLGQFGDLIREVETSINQLNALNREILRYTGPSPDPYRDYQLEKRIPDLVDRFQTEIDRLESVMRGMIEVTGETSDQTAIIDKLVIQLKDFVRRPRDIHKRLREYRNNVSALGDWIQNVSEQPLSIDYILVHSNGVKLPKANENFFMRIWHHIRLFIASFTTDFDSIGAISNEGVKETIEVWLPVPTRSRDHANVLRQLIDEDFTPKTGIGVDLKLVRSEVLLPATLTGQGPDVALSLSETLPVNYGLRGAVYDLSQFEDFEEVAARFHESALVPYELNGAYYALPEEQYFLVMFYRKDILEELGIKVPNTWDEVIEIIPSLQKHHLEFYMPVGPATVSTAEVNEIFASILYQHGGTFYNEDKTKTVLVEKEALDAFELWTQYYTDYGFSREASFINRFRSGEMPIGIASYNMYNTLSVFAPEIRGDWAFAPIPGTVQRDENGNILYDDNGEPIIRRDAAGRTLAIVLLEQSEKKEAAWEFIKWLTSTEIQVSYGRELEGVLGPGARYPTANVAALEQLPWPTKDYQILKEHWEHVRGIPQAPGSYIVARNIINAFYESYNNDTNPREALLEYAIYIDEEIARKRKEFGLD